MIPIKLNRLNTLNQNLSHYMFNNALHLVNVTIMYFYTTTAAFVFYSHKSHQIWRKNQYTDYN